MINPNIPANRSIKTPGVAVSPLGRLSAKRFALYAAFLLLLASCNKTVDVPAPVTSTNSENVYTNGQTAAAVLTGLYAKFNVGNFNGGLPSLSLLTGLSGDELFLYSGLSATSLKQYFKNALTNTNTATMDVWKNTYPIIFIANSAIEGLTSSSQLTAPLKQQLLGEAKFMRAFFYFYLANLYGDVPLVLTTNYTINALLSRKAKIEVYNQIIQDLKDAQSLLNSSYLKADAITPYENLDAERIRPTSWAATALLARVYLFTGDYVNAEMQSSTVIKNSTLFGLVPLNSVFLKNSKEAIWQLQSVRNGYNTFDAQLYILPPGGPSQLNPVYLNKGLLGSFENGDARKVNWIDSVIARSDTFYFPVKYKETLNSSVLSPSDMKEYLMVLRLSEQYLIRAEARAQQNKISDAQADLNSIRNRANLGNTSANDKASLLTAILHERQVELFTEWGHRWLDLKRTGNIEATMSVTTPQKGGTWNTNWQWYPIPLSEIQNDPNLAQNSGY